jgi:hypothetical protein
MSEVNNMQAFYKAKISNFLKQTNLEIVQLVNVTPGSGS